MKPAHGYILNNTMISKERISRSGRPLQRAGSAGNRYGTQVEYGPGGTVGERQAVQGRMRKATA
ncbi:hypothetical protein [Paenibacillus sonchi]|uniref:hypothetical protein n=1 Tax=Paenibacillus sonchi TaxID=373687 RepID=UPI001E610446|nr:hypothetical protein [Paenibacillus sonchi]